MITRFRYLNSKIVDDPADLIQLIACKIGQSKGFTDFSVKKDFYDVIK